jgi:hypothetical protein
VVLDRGLNWYGKVHWGQPTFTGYGLGQTCTFVRVGWGPKESRPAHQPASGEKHDARSITRALVHESPEIALSTAGESVSTTASHNCLGYHVS